MYWISLIVFLLLTSGAIAIFNIRFDDILNIMSRQRKTTLKDEIDLILGTPKRGFFSRETYEVEQLLQSTGRAEKFELLKKSCVILFAVGAVLALLLNNVFLVPIFALGFGLAPMWYIKSTSSNYKKQLNEQLESALSIVTTSYLRTEDIIKAVRENMEYINEPMRSTFETFVAESELINANVTSAINNMKVKIPNAVFYEWCSTLIQCQSNRSLKFLLVSVVQKFSDIRVAQAELDMMLGAPRRETFMMMFLVVANIPLLYVLNKDWFHTLMFTTPGKVALALCGAIILFSLIRVMQLSKPIEYGEVEK